MITKPLIEGQTNNMTFFIFSIDISFKCSLSDYQLYNEIEICLIKHFISINDIFNDKHLINISSLLLEKKALMINHQTI